VAQNDAMESTMYWTLANCLTGGCKPECSALTQRLMKPEFATVRGELERYSRVATSFPFGRFPVGNAANAWDVLRAMDRRYEEMRVEYLQVAEEARAARIGYYSIEQEADEHGAEFLVRGGVNPSVAVKSTLARGWTNDVGVPGFKLCHQMARTGWKNPDGSWQVLTPFDFDGDFGSHHDTCYRAYNLAREIEAHPDYASKKYLPLSPEKWGELRKTLPSIRIQ
jgi:hypothetical protein